MFHPPNQLKIPIARKLICETQPETVGLIQLFSANQVFATLAIIMTEKGKYSNDRCDYFFYRCDYIVDKIRKLLRDPDSFL